eukprot:CAMPEP_0201869050 /NCGR_PEP_ID=MMETSP0902-20130614/2711_1 /ASSEMBLY_ACC=CAM_ASM_000551 /TAXON_ID=420261 /ORGANISM="Thalassiosira antarctica, Strain CCMP982" /LENGTH=685 /DNA_ID=CAMNT_0048394489 /DNA_START=121 /DNA_END=2178 /DNA_ORIENTATION=-
MTELRAQSKLPHKTNWSDAAPLDGEELIFSISCGNSHLHWATHHGNAEDYNPLIFWRTPHLKEEDLEHEDLLGVLSRNLPDDPHDHIFGKSVDATAEDAISQSKQRAAPLISVYIVSTNRGQEALLAKIWSTVPSRFVVMRGGDFFKKEEGRYDTMGTDRLATLTGAVHLHGHPALVFDGGTATTYSATDSSGTILGGGIGPGIQSKFRSLTKDTDALPEITTEQVLARVNEAQEKGKPLPTFARNTQEAMMADAFQEFALKGRNVIEHWLEKAYDKLADNPAETTSEVKSAGAPAETTTKVNTDKRVICTGGDGDILMQLLQPHYGGVIEHMESNDRAKSKDNAISRSYVVEASKHLMHYGIASVLAAQVKLRKSKDAFSKNPHEEHVGKRVAKHFEVEADDGDNIFRGKVMKVIKAEGGENEFRIKYDDGDSEDVTTSELFDMFELFSVHGEKKSRKAAPAKGKKKPAPKKVKKAKSSDDEKAVDIPSVPAKSAKSKANGAPTEEKKTDAKKATKAEPSDVEKAVDIPSVPSKSAKSKANGAPLEEKKTDAKKVKKIISSYVEKAVHIHSLPARSAKNKANGAPPQEKKPAAKKAKTVVNNIASLVNGSDPRSFVRKRVAKDFDGDTYYGTVMEYDDTEPPAYWHAEYDDGDEEDYSKKDLIKALKYYEIKGKNDTNKSNKKS